jgi:phenylpyruvate tautomerase PptA (4-oxalocrotonate tautomerase family)
MPWIEVKWYAGRDKATKAKTMELLTKAMCEAVGCKPEAVSVVFYDIGLKLMGYPPLIRVERLLHLRKTMS